MKRSGGRSPQQVFEESDFGRRVISGFIVLTVVSIAAWNLPASELRGVLRPVLSPYVTTVGLNQSWRLFAPNPTRTSRELYAEVGYADGSKAVWRPPDGVLLDSYRTYRWRKWAAELRKDSSEEMWEPAAVFIAGETVRDGEVPTSVTLVRRWMKVPELGSGEEGVWREYAFYTLELETEGDLESGS